MKTTLFCILLLLSGIVSAQTIDHPPFKARSGSISNITRIERTPENTRVYIHAIFRPHWWIMEDGDTYLEDAATGKKYLFKSAEGIELKKEVYMPDSGTMDYVLVFEPLPSETHIASPAKEERFFSTSHHQMQLVQDRRFRFMGIWSLRLHQHSE